MTIALLAKRRREKTEDQAHGWPREREYDMEQLTEKYILIDWLAVNLIAHRPLKSKQLFVYGEPSTQKSLILHYLSKALNIYFCGARTQDYSSYDFNDLWVYDEFRAPGGDSGADEQAGFINSLLCVLDGQQTRLDAKYSRVLNKTRNVPIIFILIANELPRELQKDGPFHATHASGECFLSPISRG